MATPSSPRIEFESLEKLEAYLSTEASLDGTVFQDLDLRQHGHWIRGATLDDTVFLGCRFDEKTFSYVQQSGALCFPILKDLPYRPYRSRLYTVASLYEGYATGSVKRYEQTPDARIYRHYLQTGGPRPAGIVETLARRLHDHAITDALEETAKGSTIVAIMGGHAMARTDPGYADIAALAKRLAEDGFMPASGGGPGAMEATNLGASLAGTTQETLESAIAMLGECPGFRPIVDWLDSAFNVRAAFLPDDGGNRSLGIPTWTYGHEPPNVFATDIAKYFANSVREEGLVSIATGGIIFAPGSAGTIQEVFQDATQNHYVTLGFASPMVFFGRRFWSETKPIYPLLRRLAADKPYGALLMITDDTDEAAAFVRQFAQSRRSTTSAGET